MSAPGYYYDDPEWAPPDDQWIDNYDNQFDDARDPFLAPEDDDDSS